MQRRSFLALAAATAMTSVRGEAAGGFPLKNGDRVVFLGDSITNAGMYVEYVDAFLRTRFPAQRFDVLNLGLPSETVSGLSEPDHPYPRPNVHERLDRVLERTTPNALVACYGMNDGIYYPFSEERFRGYQAGIRKLLEKAERARAKVTLLTPPPFDPNPVRARTLPEGAPKYSWMAPYSGYDGVLSRYGEWLLTLRNKGVRVVDVHTPVLRFLEASRANEPGYALAGDGVHMNAAGHALMAAELLSAWGAPPVVDTIEVDARRRKLVRGKGTMIQADDAGLDFAWTSRIPWPYDYQWSPKLVAQARLTERLNRHRLRVSGLPEGRYTLREWGLGGVLAEFSQGELAAGVDLLAIDRLATNQHAASVLRFVQQRQRLLAPAWLTSVGHKRPDTATGLPLEEAQRRAAPLDEEARKAAAPVPLQMRLERTRA